jgi:serine/threonine protein phosphatase PrpC
LRGKVFGELAVTRSFGNAEYKRQIISEPECLEMKLSPNDDLLILSTDGLYRGMSQQHVVSRVLSLRQAGYSLT